MNVQAAQAAIGKAQRETAAGRISDARTTLLQAVKAATSREAQGTLQMALAAFHLSQGAQLDAAQAYAEANRIAGGREPITIAEARAWTAGGKPLKAVERLRTLPAAARNSFEALSALADAQRQAQHWDDAIAPARAALALKPDSRNMKLILAAALGRTGQWDEAEKLFASFGHDAVATEMKSAALVESGRVAEGRHLLRDAIARDPANVRLQTAHAMLLWMEGDKDHFADALIQASDAAPQDIGLAMAAADMLRRADQDDKALKRLEAASAMAANPALDSAMGILLGNLGRQAEGAARANAAASAAPDTDWIRRNAASALLAAGDFSGAATHTAWGLARDAADQEWMALDVIAKRGLGDETYRRLYDYERFVMPFDLSPPEGYATMEAFLEALAIRLRELHVFRNHPLDQSLRGGSQLVLNPDVPQDPLIELFFKALDAPIRAYMAKIGNDPSHPYTARNTGKYELQGAWSVRLVQGGSHVNHIHPEGWISSAFYVTVPPSVAPDAPSDDGWITFGEPRFPVPGISYEKKVCPKQGRLVLFPSYMWHGVRPFSTNAERMTIAFDVIPA